MSDINTSNLGDDFPMICETCLGQNPYVRMTKLPFGQKLCKISALPYQGFRWKAGPQGRYKETIISFTVAKERNICQACLNDMVFGLPSGVRDALLASQIPENRLVAPISDAGVNHYYNNLQHKMNNTNETIYTNENTPHPPQLDRLANILKITESKNKQAYRNLPKLCSFWLNNACNRVSKNTCPFRPCCGIYLFPEIAGSNKELSNELISLLNEKGAAVVMKTMSNDIKDALRKALKGNRDESIKKRVSGNDDLTNKYLNNMKTMNLELQPPDDSSITTIWLGNIESDIAESDILDITQPFGHIMKINLVKASKCAFIEYSSRDMAEKAVKFLYKACVIKGHVINVNWYKPKENNTICKISTNDSDGYDLLPPGLDNIPIASYSSSLVVPNLISSSTNVVGQKRSNDTIDQQVNKKVVYPSMNPSRLGAAL